MTVKGNMSNMIVLNGGCFTNIDTIDVSELVKNELDGTKIWKNQLSLGARENLIFWIRGI